MKLNVVEIYHVLWSVMLLSKNIYNATLFILHNIISSYTYNKESKSYLLKENLHQYQKEIIHLTNQTINKLNQNRENKYHHKLNEYLNHILCKELNIIIEHDTDNNLKEPKEKTPLCLLGNHLAIKEFQQIILDKNLIEHVLKLKESTNKAYQDYSKIYSSVAQYAVYKAIDDTSNYFKSIVEYFKTYKVGQLANAPQLPKYLGKNERLTIELNEQRFSQKGTLFTVLKHQTLYNDFFKPNETKINQTDINIFNQFNLKQELISQLDKRLNGKKYQLKTIRFVPQKFSGKGKNKYPLKIETIVEIEDEIKEDSFLSYIVNYYEENKTQYKKPTLSYYELNQEMQNKVIKDYIKNNFTNEFNCRNKSKLNRIGGLDLGMNNIASLALTHGKNQIYSGKLINHQLTHLNTKLDTIKSSIFESNLSEDLYKKVKTNQKINEQNSEIRLKNKLIIDEKEKLSYLDKLKLEVNELQDIKLANSLIYSNLNYNKILVEIGHYKNNILHQLSNDIITRCVRNNIQCLVIGHNEGWKEQVELGKKQNRLFLSIPHSELIHMLIYKGNTKGIVVIESEESYTSQSNFIHHDNLPQYHKTKNSGSETKSKENKPVLNKESNNDIKMDSENNHSHLNIINKSHHEINNSSKRKQYRFSGKRSQLNRHHYHIEPQHNKPLKIHADLNGAFNIIRKICQQFHYQQLITLNYEVRGMNKHNNKGKRISVMFSLLTINKPYQRKNGLFIKELI